MGNSRTAGRLAAAAVLLAPLVFSRAWRVASGFSPLPTGSTRTPATAAMRPPAVPPLPPRERRREDDDGGPRGRFRWRSSRGDEIPPAADASGNSGSNNNDTDASVRFYDPPAPLEAPDEPNGANENANDDDDDTRSIREGLKNTVFLGIEPTPDVVAIAAIYFVEGALGLARLAQTFLLKDELHLGPAELSALTGIFTLPWTIKPLYGFLSDGVPLFGYRRRSYLVLAGLVGCVSYSAVGHDFWGLLGGDALAATVAALVLSSACIAFSDVVADGIVVQKTRESAATNPKLAGGLQSLCWGSAAIGGLLSAYFSGSLLEVIGPRDVFALTAVLPFVVASIGFLIDEEPLERSEAAATNDDADSSSIDVRSQIDALWQAIKQPEIYKPAAFIFLWQSTPTSEGAMLFFMTDDLGFGPEILGRVRFIGAFSSLFGVWLYNTYLKTRSIKDILFWSTIVSFPLGLLDLVLISHANRLVGIPDTWFVFGDDVVLSVLGEIAFLPTLVLAARLCPKGVEAVLFATLMSINNGAGTVGTEVGALLTKGLGVTETNFDNLGLLSFVCNVTSLYPLLFIGWLDGVGSVSEQDIEDEETATTNERTPLPKQAPAAAASAGTTTDTDAA